MPKFLTNHYKRYRHIRRVWLNTWHALRARRHYNYPDKSMRLIGITGTDGKTTTATMLAEILQNSGRRVGLISTVEAKINGQSVDTGLHVSTPGPSQSYQLLARMRDERVDDVVIEATSHGLDQRRLFGMSFDIGIITNVAAEHLDYHGTIEAYARAKARLLEQSSSAVLNADDKIASQLNLPKLPQLLFGIQASADITADAIEEQDGGSTFKVRFPNQNKAVNFFVPLPGVFNISNALAAISAAHLLGVPKESMQNGLKSVSVEGRWQILYKKDFMTIVDFAHTPQSFSQILPVARKLVGTKGRLIHVFGSAAQRDESKRSEMGRLSGQYADLTVLTMEDPRHESLDRIQSMLIEGLEKAGKRQNQGWRRIDDRQQAIEWAISEAVSGDVVIITGKGHEKSLSIKGEEKVWKTHSCTYIDRREKKKKRRGYGKRTHAHT